MHKYAKAVKHTHAAAALRGLQVHPSQATLPWLKSLLDLVYFLTQVSVSCCSETATQARLFALNPSVKLGGCW